jgi:osmotically-inducible protein OsmY
MLIVAGALGGCAAAPAKSADICENLRHSPDDAGLKDVSAGQDRDKGDIAPGGRIRAAADKSQAESIATSFAGGQVVAIRIAAMPAGHESDAKAVNSGIDKGSEENLDAAFIQSHLGQNVKFHVKSGVVTLTGEVNSESLRAQAAGVATPVPNAQQVVNELQVRTRKATSN